MIHDILHIQQTEFSNTNKELKENLTITTKTTVKISIMFLRIKEAKRRIDKKRQIYEKLCKDFSYSIKEQAELIKTVLENGYNHHQSSVQQRFHASLARISQLLYENAHMRLQLSATRIYNKTGNGKIIKKIMKEIAQQLAQKHLESAQRIFGQTKIPDDLQSKILCGSELTIFDVKQMFK